MIIVRRIGMLARALFHRRAVEVDFDREMRHHLELETAANQRRGMTSTDAGRQARVAFGSVPAAREGLRDEYGTRWLEDAWADARLTLRGIRSRPGFAFAVILTLALGIGVNIAMFGMIDRSLFRPPAYLTNPSSVNRLYVDQADAQGKRSIGNQFSLPMLRDIAASSRTLTSVAGFTSIRMAIGEGEGAGIQRVAMVTSSLFGFFGAQPEVGRFFAPDEDALPAGARVAVLSDAYWRSQFGARRDIVGTTLLVGVGHYTVIGVAPAGFEGVSDGQPSALFLPATAYLASQDPKAVEDYNWRALQLLVRRKAGISSATVSSDLTAVFRRATEARSPSASNRSASGPSVSAAPLALARGPMAGPESKVLQWVAAVALIVLIIATANVANLLLTRGLTRRREMSVRRALGGTRGRLMRQVLTEAAVLSAIATVVGLFGAQLVEAALGKLLLGAAADDWASVGDGRTLLAAAVLGAASAMLAGLLPAFNVNDGDLSAAVKAGMRQGVYRRSGAQSALLILQTTLSVVLLVGAGLFVRSVRAVESTPLGYDADHIVYLEASMRGTLRDPAERTQLTNRLADEARAIPGVAGVTPVASVPFWANDNRPVFVDGIDSTAKLGRFIVQAGSADYFKTAGTKILEGRSFAATDRAGTALVAVVNEPMARALWAGQNPIGKCFRLGADTAPCTTVIGVAEPAKTRDITASGEFILYLPMEQYEQQVGPPMMISLFARVNGSPDRAAPLVQARLQRLMPGPSYIAARPFHEIIDPRMRAWISGERMFLWLGGLALVLAAIGLYAIVSFGVAQRTQEIGIRMALGARASTLLRQLVSEALLVVFSGVALGVGLALVASRAIGDLLFRVSPHDPLVFATVGLSLLGVGVIASALPALRAARVDPTVALREG
jgi:putative ABC transport system permease protein